MFSFQKFYINGTTATNITPSYGAFGNIELSIVFSDSWGTYNPPQLYYSFSVFGSPKDEWLTPENGQNLMKFNNTIWHALSTANYLTISVRGYNG